jgi:hypothetical protein
MKTHGRPLWVDSPWIEWKISLMVSSVFAFFLLALRPLPFCLPEAARRDAAQPDHPVIVPSTTRSFGAANGTIYNA